MTVLWWLWVSRSRYFTLSLKLPLDHYCPTLSTKIFGSSASLCGTISSSTKLIPAVTKLYQFSLPSSSLPIGESRYSLLTCPVMGPRQRQSRVRAGPVKVSTKLWRLRAGSYAGDRVGTQFGMCVGRWRWMLCVVLSSLHCEGMGAGGNRA